MRFTSTSRMLGVTTWLLLAAVVQSQSVNPSNNSQDLLPFATSPRFLLNGTEMPHIAVVHLAPLGEYAQLPHSQFTNTDATGQIVNVDASNANHPGNTNQFSYMSCDPGAYPGNLNAEEVFKIVVSNQNLVILYSETADHCMATGLDYLPTISGILTTTNSTEATALANLGLTVNSKGTATILPDLSSYTNFTSPNSVNNSGFGSSPTTAVAMIILYSITGLITALFVVIIITGAIRAHRHPERYGPRNIMGRGRQSRARGIARAMLDTLPIVKFGDRDQPDTSKPPGSADIELAPPNATAETAVTKDATATTKAVSETETEQTPSNSSDANVTSNPDGSDELGHLGCSICTEDFTKGEDIRVLPCNHKFHPDCVDPWLLNVSGTCPLCRIDLRTGTEDENGEPSDATERDHEDDELPPPLGGLSERRTSVAPYGDANPTGGRRDTIANLRRMAGGTREERIAALRRLRQERRVRTQNMQGDEERTGLTRRLRERFRILTQRTEHDPTRGTFGDDPRRSSFARP